MRMAQVRPGTAAFDLSEIGDSDTVKLEVVDAVHVTKEYISKDPGVDCDVY
jgi:hypothetical protein